MVAVFNFMHVCDNCYRYQVVALRSNGYRVILIDSRGHGRSTRDPSQAYSYEMMTDDVISGEKNFIDIHTREEKMIHTILWGQLHLA